jgi:hypothetical protein
MEKFSIQVQISFTKKDKSKYLRVLSASLPTTAERGIAEKDMNVSVVALNAVQSAARLGAADPLLARHDLLGVQRMLQRCVGSSNASIVQREEYGNFVTWSEDLETALINLQGKKGALDDITAKTLQRMKNITKTWFLAGSKKDEIIAKRKKHVQKKG